MFFLIKDDELLEKYNEIQEKVKNSIKKEFNSEPVYNEKYLKTKKKSFDGKIHTNFHNNKILKESSHCIYLSVILIDSIFRTSNNYYPQVFLERYKYIKEKRCPSILLTTQKFLLMVLIEKILMKKTLIRKILMKKIEHRNILSDFGLFIKYSYNLNNLHSLYGKICF